MKTLKNLVIATVMLTAAISAKAEWVSGHFRSNGTYVNPYYRTPANGIVYDDLSYRGYPSQQPGYISPRSYGCETFYSAPYSVYGTSTTFGNSTFHNYRSSFGNSVSGTTLRFGDTSYTSLYGW